MIVYLFALMAALALAGWLIRRGEHSEYRQQDRPPDDVDWDALEEAEREVQSWDSTIRPEDEAPGADWGPGTGRPRPPELL